MLYGGGGKGSGAGGRALDKESPYFTIKFSPDHEDVGNGGVGNPGFGAGEKVDTLLGRVGTSDSLH